MRALLFGLFVGYFLVACAPVLWDSQRIWFVASVLFVVVGAERLARWVFGPRLSSSQVAVWMASSYRFTIGLLVAALALGSAVNGVNSNLTGIVGTAGCAEARLMLRVQIVGLPRTNPSGSRFDARVLDVDPGHPQCQQLQGAKLRLGFRGDAPLRPNQKMLAQIKLRPIRGSVSPGAFDHELNSALQGVALGGYVTQLFALRDSHPQTFRLVPSIDERRYSYRQYISGLDLEYPGVILALATGDTALLDVDDWELLQDSGTVHLLVISGLHVGLVSALLFFLLRPVALLFVGLLPGAPPCGLLHAGLTVALLLVYVHWVGASVPAFRAWLMVAVVLVGWALERRVQAHTLVLIAALGVVWMTPLAGLQAGFWLSFALVAWLLSRSPDSSINNGTTEQTSGDERNQLDQQVHWAGDLLLKGRALLGLHVGATLLLLPLLGWLGLPIAPVGPLANFFAVPYVTLLLVPWILLSVLLLPTVPELSAHLLAVADRMVGYLFDALRWFVEIWPAVSLAILSVGTLAAALVLVSIVLLPLSRGIRSAAASALLIWMLQADESSVVSTQGSGTPEHGEFNVQVLDVGQGLSVVVATAETVILYDTGASYPSGFNYADSVVIPALQRRQVLRLDALVISHGDNDHAGGAAVVMERFSPTRLAGSIPSVDSCQWHHGSETTQHWLSAGVELRLMNFEAGLSANDRSCVLLISGTHAQALLAGDIELSAERALLAELPSGVDMVTVAHHGSLTSSGEAFVQKLHPGLAVVSAGYRNRFGHPHIQVVERYEGVGARVVNTADEGTIGWRSADVGAITSARALRIGSWQLAAPLAVVLAQDPFTDR